MIAKLYYYAKAVVAGLSGGAVYLTAFIGPDFNLADLSHVSVMHWLGAIAAVLIPGGLTAIVTNGPKPGAVVTPQVATIVQNILPQPGLKMAGPVTSDQPTPIPAVTPPAPADAAVPPVAGK